MHFLQSKATCRISRRVVAAGLAGGVLSAMVGKSAAAQSVGQMTNLETDPAEWKVWIDPGDAPPDAVFFDAPALIDDAGRQALRLAINGGTRPYTHVHCYRTMDALPDARRVTLRMNWKFSHTTWNNEGGPSTIQMIEPAMNCWDGRNRYEWALQWQNVGDGSEQGFDAPAWRIWNGHSWIKTGFSQRLEPNTWHSLALRGRVDGDTVHYSNMTSDDVTIPLDIDFPAIPADEQARSAVTMQLGGNYNEDPYECFVRNVGLTWKP